MSVWRGLSERISISLPTTGLLPLSWPNPVCCLSGLELPRNVMVTPARIFEMMTLVSKHESSQETSSDQLIDPTNIHNKDMALKRFTPGITMENVGSQLLPDPFHL